MKRSLKRTGGRADTPTKRADALNTPAELEADRRPRAEGCLDRGGGVLGLPERGCLEGDADKRRSAEQEALLQEGAAVTSRSRCYKKEPLLQAAASVTRTCGQRRSAEQEPPTETAARGAVTRPYELLRPRERDAAESRCGLVRDERYGTREAVELYPEQRVTQLRVAFENKDKKAIVAAPSTREMSRRSRHVTELFPLHVL